MSAPSLKSYIREQIEQGRKMVAADIAATPEDLLLTSPGGAARAAVDYVYELSYVHRRFAKRLRGEDPGQFPQGFLVAPDEYRSKEKAIEEFGESTDDMLSAWNAVPDDRIAETIVLPAGQTTPLELMSIAITHMAYHDGQLNQLQALNGDTEIHWDFE